MQAPTVSSDLSWVSEAVRPHPTTGPRVTRLLADLADADAPHREALVNAFWADATRLGAPLVEPVEDAPGYHTLTFLYRGHRTTRHVLLFSNRLTDRARLADALLRHIPGTDIWHLGFRLRADHRGAYRIAADISTGEPPADPARLQEFLRTLQRYAAPDPLNSRTIPTRWGGPDCSVFALPDAPPQPWEGRTAEAPHGRVERHRVDSPALGTARDVWVYLPPGTAAGHRDLPVLVLGDGDMWLGGMGLQDTLDALIADGTLPPLIVLAPDSVDNATRWREMGARDSYVSFLADDVLPWAAGRWPLTTDPRRTVVAGQSLGGLTALYAGLVRAERFGNVLAQSPSLWWHPGLPVGGVPQTPVVGEPWLVGRYAQAGPRELNVHLDVGLHEGPMVGYSRAMHETLRAAGHPVTLREFNGGHDYACWHGALLDALAAMLAPVIPAPEAAATR
ncbi:MULTISPECIES: enterochelin esterase [unclassified Streptomyces]|uniref:enterochelin esterase n=1 Tax=unclassified Streptomyces TaxID=2593676 RepID=UPI00278C8EA9|nr:MULTISPECIES: enterochelin esterase [unclassified Streptomyces]